MTGGFVFHSLVAHRSLSGRSHHDKIAWIAAAAMSAAASGSA
ncbi:unnamed protein product [Ciceribacter selenitireducens ATCC BAA-1503]|uniref:Uncharacterized protein n=1 Tax=Ciceribacter selenitireducens ATCC BAA-1503 TaxID=1336235 RepID=A0A376AEU2_9HYPH|nr:unnamed protein product [Ciceribacter selenitireducens ATCC BAA-1503]